MRIKNRTNSWTETTTTSTTRTNLRKHDCYKLTVMGTLSFVNRIAYKNIGKSKEVWRILLWHYDNILVCESKRGA